MYDTLRLAVNARRCAALALVSCCALWSTSAQAWTRTRVEHAQAHLTVDAAARAQVVLQIGVHVQGGWLSRFEIAGLDRDFALDPEHPPQLTGEDGMVYVPEVRGRADGSVVLTFATRRSAPHRGLHQLALTYTTQLKADGARIAWALPSWSVDLENASVTVDAPAGSALGAAPDDEVAVQRTREQLGARTLLSFRRAQLPRTVPLAVQFVLPADAASAATTLAARAVEEHRIRSSAAACAALLVLGLCALKRRIVGAACARQHAKPVPVLPVSPGVRAACMLGLGVAAGLVYELHPGVGLLAFAGMVALALERGFVRNAATRPKNAAPAPGLRAIAAQRVRDWFGAAAWFDATAPLGFGLLASAYALAALRLGLSGRPGLWLEVLLVVTPLWLTATRFHLAHTRPRVGSPARVREPHAERFGDPRADRTSIRRAGADRPAQDRAA